MLPAIAERKIILQPGSPLVSNSWSFKQVLLQQWSRGNSGLLRPSLLVRTGKYCWYCTIAAEEANQVSVGLEFGQQGKLNLN